MYKSKKEKIEQDKTKKELAKTLNITTDLHIKNTNDILTRDESTNSVALKSVFVSTTQEASVEVKQETPRFEDEVNYWAEEEIIDDETSTVKYSNSLVELGNETIVEQTLQLCDEKVEVAEKLCRICLEGDDQDDLVIPCKCTGTMEHIHKSCLKYILENKMKKETGHEINENLEKIRCEVCKYQYEIVLEKVAQKRSYLDLINDNNSFFFLLSFFLILPLTVVGIVEFTRIILKVDKNNAYVWYIVCLILDILIILIAILNVILLLYSAKKTFCKKEIEISEIEPYNPEELCEEIGQFELSENRNIDEVTQSHQIPPNSSNNIEKIPTEINSNNSVLLFTLTEAHKSHKRDRNPVAENINDSFNYIYEVN